MRTPSALYRTTPTIYKSELKDCPHCGHELVEMSYLSGLKTVQTMTEAITIAYRPKHCPNPECSSAGSAWGSARWQGIAPKYSIYGYDVLGQIGWERQKGKAHFEAIHARLRERIPISESQVRYLYHQRYLPLLACHERGHLSELSELGCQGGLVLSMDGLMPEGGEAQLWVVRELSATRGLDAAKRLDE
jgi:hypothetical protein